MLNQEVLPSPLLAVPGYKDEHGSSPLSIVVIQWIISAGGSSQPRCVLPLPQEPQPGGQVEPTFVKGERRFRCCVECSLCGGKRGDQLNVFGFLSLYERKEATCRHRMHV